MKLGKRLVKFAVWTLALLVALGAGLIWFAHAVITDSDTAARLIRAQAAIYLPHAQVEMGRVNVSVLKGQITVSHLSVLQGIDGEVYQACRVPWLSVKLDPRQILHGKAEPREVIISQPTLRVCRRKDGTWNFQGLLADPFPTPEIQDPPPIIIRNGTIELREMEPEAQVPPLAASALAAHSSVAAPGPLQTNQAGSQGPAVGGTSESPAVRQPGRSTESSGVAILRDVSMRIEAGEAGKLKFEGSARGDLFGKLNLEGTIDPITGDAVVSGDLKGLTLSENLRRRLPPELARPYDELSMRRGEIDVEIRQVAFHPAAEVSERLRYDLGVQLRGGVWECPSLPFSVNDLLANLDIRDGQLVLDRAVGRNGITILRAKGKVGLAEIESCPFDLRVDLEQLDLDRRLQERTPPEFAELWDVFKPRGQIDAYLRLVRSKPGDPVGVGATVECRDVATTYRHFAYPLEHLNGRLTLERERLTVNLRGLVGERPATMKGTIDQPGPDAIVNLNLEAESFPIDKTFMTALPPDIRKVVDQFHPSGSVKAKVNVARRPLVGPMVKEEGHLAISAILDLNPRCEMTWVGLPYTVRNLTGRLEIHPDLWKFEGMRGDNGQAIITGSGVVKKLPLPLLPNGEPPLEIDLKIQAQNLPFNNDLRNALQPAWQKSWEIINPTGYSDIVARIHVEPGKPDVNHISITPRADSHIVLVIPRTPREGVEPGSTIELRMENVRGRFDFDNGKVSMNDVDFFFHGAPIHFNSGSVMVEDSGRFALAVSELEVKGLQINANLRKIMPPMMAQFALRLDDGRPYYAKGDIQIGWSGEQGEPAWCRWARTLVVFNDNSLKTGIPLEHIQGQLENVRGWSNGLNLEVHGNIHIASMSFMDQQIIELISAFHIDKGVARLDDTRAQLHRGVLTGNGEITLDDTPKYSTSLRLNGALLEAYAQTLPGRQSFRGTLNAAVDLNGHGNDIRNLQGKGEAHITNGELGEQSVFLKLIDFLNGNLFLFGSQRSTAKTVFDSADVEFRINHGTTTLDPIKLTGNAFSLSGDGTRSPLGDLDIRLGVIMGRDQYRIPVISPIVRKASEQVVGVRIRGTASNPKFDIEPVPQIQKLGNRRNERRGNER